MPRTFGKGKDSNSRRNIDLTGKIMGEPSHTQSERLEPQCHLGGLEQLPGK